MSQHVEGPRKTFKAGTALEAFRRVKITDPATSPKTIGYAGAGDQCIGITEAYVASGADCAIYLANAQGTRKMTATGRDHGQQRDLRGCQRQGGGDGNGRRREGAGDGHGRRRPLGSPAGRQQRHLDGDHRHDGRHVPGRFGPRQAPRGLKSQTGGTGDYVAYYQAPATLTGNRTYTGPADADDTLVGVAAAQTLTNKTLTTPVIGSGGVRGGGVTHVHRHRVSTAEVNAGHELLPAISGYKYRIHDVALIAIGGNAARDACSVRNVGVKLLRPTPSGRQRAGCNDSSCVEAGTLGRGRLQRHLRPPKRNETDNLNPWAVR